MMIKIPNQTLPVKFTSTNELAKSFRGIDVIIDGHTHSVLDSPVLINDVIAQAGEHGKFLGRIDLR